MACVRVPDPVKEPGAGGAGVPDVRDLHLRAEDLAAWLVDEGVAPVAMEATGVYWKPVWQSSRGDALEVLLVNARHMKNVPGRKTDVADSAWLA